MTLNIAVPMSYVHDSSALLPKVRRIANGAGILGVPLL